MASDGEPGVPALSGHGHFTGETTVTGMTYRSTAQYFGRCDTAHFLACWIGARGGCAARNRWTVGKASICSRHAQTAGNFGYRALPSGAKPKANVIGSM